MNIILQFLTKLHKENKSYSYISSVRSALASVVSVPGYPKLSDHPLISRFIKGIFHINPPKPRYSYMWDVNKVFSFLKQQGGNDILDQKQLTQKLAMLLLLYSGQRCSTLLSLDIKFMDLQEGTCIFYPNKLLKHSRQNRKSDVFIFNACGQELRLCPIKIITEYLKRRNQLVDDKNITSLFITCSKPYKTPHRDTIARWVRNIMIEAGLDTNVFKPHSCRSASTSMGKDQGLPIEQVLKYGSWKNFNTFLKHYCKNIITEDPVNELQKTLIG